MQDTYAAMANCDSITKAPAGGVPAGARPPPAAHLPVDPLPPLATVTRFVSPKPEQLYMTTESAGVASTVNTFYDSRGSVMFRLESSTGFFEKKVLTDSSGKVVLKCKKFPLSLAKWSICSPGGSTLVKTRTVSGMAKYGLEVLVPSRSSSRPTFMVTPTPTLQGVLMWQANGRRQEDTPMCEAAYGSNVVMGMVSAAVQDWTYHVALDPGADAALVCCLLSIYTGLVEWNALGGAFGMM